MVYKMHEMGSSSGPLILKIRWHGRIKSDNVTIWNGKWSGFKADSRSQLECKGGWWYIMDRDLYYLHTVQF